MNLQYFCPSCSIDTEHFEIKKHYSNAFSQEFSILECVQCKTLMTHPFLTDHQIDEYYQDEEINGAGRYIRWKKKYRYIHNWINKYLNTTKFNVLEIGSNSGNLLRYFKEKSDCNVIGIELSEKCKKYSEEINGVKVYGNWLANFIKDNPFKAQLVLMIHTFEHITNPEKLLKEVQEVLTDDGYLYIEIPNGRMIEFDILPESNPLCIPFHAYLYNMDSLCQILTNNGYEIVKKRYYSKKEDGGSITSTLSLYTKNKIMALLGDNIISKFFALLTKALIRFNPNRVLFGYTFSKFNKASSIAVLCKKIE